MTRTIAALLLTAALFFPVRAFAQTGSLQITCEPGVRIYIDHQFEGVTNETDNGLYVDGLAPGDHRLKAIKKGFKLVLMQVNIIDGEAVEVRIELEPVAETPRVPSGAGEETWDEEPAPVSKSKPVPKANTGTFLLSSDPVGAKVYIDGEYQGDADIVVADREAGSHMIVFRLGEQRLSGTYTLSAQEVLRLRANFLYEDIINLTAKERSLRTNRPLPSN